MKSFLLSSVLSAAIDNTGIEDCIGLKGSSEKQVINCYQPKKQLERVTPTQ